MCRRRYEYNRLLVSHSLRFSKLKHDQMDNVTDLSPHMGKHLKTLWIWWLCRFSANSEQQSLAIRRKRSSTTLRCRPQALPFPYRQTGQNTAKSDQSSTQRHNLSSHGKSSAQIRWSPPDSCDAQCRHPTNWSKSDCVDNCVLELSHAVSTFRRLRGFNKLWNNFCNYSVCQTNIFPTSII